MELFMAGMSPLVLGFSEAKDGEEGTGCGEVDKDDDCRSSVDPALPSRGFETDFLRIIGASFSPQR
jgi:hypothetical protein